METQVLTREQILALPLKAGGHSSREDGLCAMEMVAYLAGAPHSASPPCACPITHQLHDLVE